MSDAKLWIDEVGCTATITGTNVSYTMPLWALDVMRDIIWADAEKEVEVTHSDFDTQQELLDRYRAENAKLREIIADLEKLLPESERWYIHETVKAIVEDNAKLRELVRELYEIAQPEAPSMFEAEFADRMRELEVEVD